jgi:hypothetical protein
MLCCYTNCCNSYTANMFCVILMSQHVADTSFNLTRLAIAAGTQRLLLFLMYLRCRLALPAKGFILNVYCMQALVSCCLYVAFAASIAYASPEENADPSPIDVVQRPALLGKMRYIGIIAAVEIGMHFSLFAPFFVSHRLPLDVPHVINRYGEMTLIAIGEISFALTQCAR